MHPQTLLDSLPVIRAGHRESKWLAVTLAFFDDPGADNVDMFGGKAASLAKLGSAGRIPPGFSLSVDEFKKWVDSGSGDMPDDVAAEIKQSYSALERLCSVIDVPVAVRSSAVDEDGIGESFAGLHDTFLNVIGAEAVVEAIIKCWRSLGNEQTIEYRKNNGLEIDSAAMVVVVQQLVFADVSAVAFSANPVSGSRDEVLINANYGLGEAVVSGLTTPDSIIIDRNDLSKQTLTIGAKEKMTVRTDGGTEEKSVPRMMQAMPVLTEEQAAEIAQLVVNLENHNGWPVDVECAIHDSQLYLLQCRPITTLN
jgi:phosphoenolpyruvate synthase/pyruvate phosphate dikinase